MRVPLHRYAQFSTSYMNVYIYIYIRFSCWLVNSGLIGVSDTLK